MTNKQYSIRLVEGEIKRFVCLDVSTYRLNDKKFSNYAYAMLPPVDRTRIKRTEDKYVLILLGQYFNAIYREMVDLIQQDKFSFQKNPVFKLRTNKTTDRLGPVIKYSTDTCKQDINVIARALTGFAKQVEPILSFGSNLNYFF